MISFLFAFRLSHEYPFMGLDISAFSLSAGRTMDDMETLRGQFGEWAWYIISLHDCVSDTNVLPLFSSDFLDYTVLLRSWRFW